MNEELPDSANRLPFCFFILHSYFFICFWSPPCRPDAPSGSRLLKLLAQAKKHLCARHLIGYYILPAHDNWQWQIGVPNCRRNEIRRKL
jgi:hypothetical protein